MAFPTDIQDNEWNQDNLPMWRNPQVTNLAGAQLLPLEAKALHVIGTLAQIFNSVGYVLYCGAQERPYADYYLYAYLLACTAIELLGRCQTGERSITRSTLRSGLQGVGLQTVTVNINRGGQPTGYVYNEDMLAALRNLAGHGQAVASANGQRQDVILHVELLEAIAGQAAQALPEVVGDVGIRPMADLYPGSNVEGITIIVLGASQDQGIFEIGDELGVEAHLLQIEGLKGLAGAEEAMEGDPQQAGGFAADLDAGVAQSCSDLG
jgi:hypothetical protein